jgi:hypothetical protein
MAVCLRGEVEIYPKDEQSSLGLLGMPFLTQWMHAHPVFSSSHTIAASTTMRREGQ